MSQNLNITSSESPAPHLEPKDQIDILMAEYGFIKAEMQTYITLFHRHTNFLPLVLTATTAVVMGAVAILIRADRAGLIGFLDYKIITLFSWDSAAYQLLGFLAFALIVTWGLFSASASLSYIYIIEILARRVETIEREVNKLAGRNLLCWEIGISPRLIRSANVPYLWLRPSTFRILWSYVGFLWVMVLMLVTAIPLLGTLLGWGFILYALCGILLEAVLYIQYKRKISPSIIEIVNSAADQSG